MFIMVDTNEQAHRNVNNPKRPVDEYSKSVARLLKVFPNLQITPLDFGDINIILDDASILAIERKTADDFVGSIGGGHIFRQVEDMSNGSKWCCIIVEGTIEFNKDDMTVINGEVSNWTGSSVRGAMMAIQWAGCPILFTRTQDFPYTVADVISFCSKPDVHRQSLGRKRIVTFPPIMLKEEIMSAFPGVGLKRTKALFEFANDKNKNDDHEATLSEALCWASSLHLIDKRHRPEGWGDKTVENFRAAMGLKTIEVLDIKEDKHLEVVPYKPKSKTKKEKEK